MASTYIYRASGTPTSTRKFTFSFWVKKSGLGADQFIVSSFTDANNRLHCAFDSNDRFDFIAKVSSSNIIRTNPSMRFRDPSAWYHIVLNVDTTQSTAADRSKVYVNGVEQTDFSSGNKINPSQNADVNISGDHFIGAYDNSGSPSLFLNGCLAHVHYTDGYTYAASTFGETDSTSGIWKPKTAPSVTYGTNGFFLKFENSGNLDLDSSGNNLSFTTAGTLTQNVDTPSNNFPTLNPLPPSQINRAMENGNLYTGGTSDNYFSSSPTTMACGSGKWYFEIKDETDWGSTSDSTRRYGIANIASDSLTQSRSTAGDVRFSDGNYAYAYMNASGVRHAGATISGSTSTHPTFAEGDFIMVAMDLDNLKLYFGKNGTWLDSGNPASGASGTGAVATLAAGGTWAPYLEVKYGSDTASINLGQGYFRTTVAGTNADANGHGKFKYSVPSGYYAICSKNIKEFG